MIDWSKARTPESVARENAREAARRYLAETDWMVVRAAETGKPVPAEVQAQRTAAREALNG